MGWLQRLDHFQRPQSDFSEPTLGGVIVTLLLGAAVIGATAYEFVNWSVPELSSTMVVKSHWDDMLKLAVSGVRKFWNVAAVLCNAATKHS
jgi:hypothetical protein